MENKINIAELLKDCPKGMELNCLTFNNVFFQELDWSTLFPIICYRINNGIKEYMYLTEFGSHFTDDDAKCIIFPKGKTTWEGFVPPCKFKAGDVLYVDCADEESDGDLYKYIFILKEIDNLGNHFSYCHLYIDKLSPCSHYLFGNRYTPRLATEEEKEKLFKAIKDNGYKWNPETKILEKLPKFKVGDSIRLKGTSAIYVVTEIREDSYMLDDKYISLRFKTQDQWELVPNKFDINTLIPFESRVLVRDNDYDEWKGAFWSHLRQKADIKYDTIRGVYRQCIPYNDDTKHLLGKTNSCNDYYKIWK